MRVNRGSTWMTFAPRGFASITHWNPTGWASAMFEPWMMMQSALARSCWNVGGAAATEDGPQTGDGGGVSNTRLVLDLDGAQRREQLLDEVVLLVVQRRAAEAGDAQRAADRSPSSSMSCQVSCAGLDTRSAIMSIAVSRSRSSHSVPYGRAVADLRLPQRAGHQVACWREPLGHSRPREIGLSGSPSIWMTFPSLTKTRCPQPTAQ